MKNVKISKKLPLIMIAILILSSLVTGTIGLTLSSENTYKNVAEKLGALRASRIAALENYLASISEDLSSLSKNTEVKDAMLDFTAAWEMIGSNQTETLQKLYITDNPHPTGQKEELDYARDGSAYSAYHEKYHDWFRHHLREKGYYDIFLFSPEGNLVYTVFKELDYATNVNTGKWKDTDLGNAFRAARDGKDPSKQYFFDFKPYAPSHGAPASFISQAVYTTSGRFLGVLVFQMPIERINRVMQISAGMGESGETYIVGTDHLMRSDSRFSEESTILKTEVTGTTVDAALAGEKGVELVKDYRGIPVFSAYGPIDFLGTRWAVLAEIDKAEIAAPIA